MADRRVRPPRLVDRRPPAGENERRLPCPVCIGTVMQKLAPVPGQPLVLDACKRCGGGWFDAGEVAALRRARPDALWAKIALQPDAFRMKCHRCQAAFERNKPNCPACGWENVLSCPACRNRLTSVERDGLRLDACQRCRGVWFDNTELASIWNSAVTALAGRTGRVPATRNADNFLFDIVLFSALTDPYVTVLGAHAVGQGAGGVAEVAGGAIEATGEAASSVFSVIADLLGSIFDGL